MMKFFSYPLTSIAKVIVNRHKSVIMAEKKKTPDCIVECLILCDFLYSFGTFVIRRVSSSRCVRLFRTIRKPYSRQKSISHCFATKVSPCAVTARSRRLEIHLPTVFAVYPSRRATFCSVSMSWRSDHNLKRRSQKSAGGTRGWRGETEEKICGRTSGHPAFFA